MRLDNKIIKRPIIDFAYSMVAYALPTFVLQFVILPFLADRLSSEDNGLFLALFNAIRLCVSLFITPLSNIRLLKKKECNIDTFSDKGFNFLFVLVTCISTLIVITLAIFYYKDSANLWALLRLVAVLVLLSIHDYYSIAFRINIDYKSILVDNILIVLGYVFGIVLMWIFGYWELIFICGYATGIVYTFAKSGLWKNGIHFGIKKETVSEYCQLSVSSGLNNATTYCDKMLIFPLLGGYSVSVYNAAAVASKMMSLISVPLRNVLLSYMVDTESISVSKTKNRKVVVIFIGLSIVIYGGFYGISIVFCKMLYPKYFADALRYIPIILLAVIFETYAGLIKTYLLRFEKTMIQVVTSCAKVFLYLLSVVVFNIILKLGLVGFCASIVIADFIHLIMVVCFLVRNLRNKMGESKDV